MASKTVIYTLAVALFLAGIGAWFLMHSTPRDDASTPLTQDAKAYVRNLKLSDVTMKATESYVQQTITEIEGKVTNAGDRNVKQVLLFCIFYSPNGQVVIRERVPIVKSELKPGETRAFRLPFDDIPSNWNNQMPQLVIARIDFS